ncbi:hypothetical protein Tco_1099664, partial [Tanacetum coccineum]
MNPVAAKQVSLDNALICPRLLNQDFVEPPSEEELVPFIQEIGYSGKCDMLSAIHKDQMHQPWRTFAAIINWCISGKRTRLDRLRESRAQILWARKEHMPFLRFTKVITNHFISKDKTISMRNKINLHTVRDDTLLSTLKYVSKTQDYQQKSTPKKARKFKKVASPSRKLSHVLEEEHAVKLKRAKRPAKKSTTVPTVSVVIRDTLTLLKVTQLKKTLKKSNLETHKLHASGSIDGVGSIPKVPNEQEDKTTNTYKGTSTKPGVPDVPKYLSESENESWGDNGDDDSNDDDSDDVTKDDDNDDVDSDADGD